MIPGIEVKIGADTSGLDTAVAKTGAALGKLEASATTAGNQIGGKLAPGVARAGSAFSAGGQGARMFAMQLSQVAQQTSASGNFIQALAIQIPDMTLGFGAAGIAAGILGSVALPLLAGALMNAGTSAEALQDATDGLTERTDAYVSASERSLASTAKMIEQYGKLAGVARKALGAIASVEQFEAIQALDKAVGVLAERFNILDYIVQDASGTMTYSFEGAGRALGIADEAAQNLIIAFDAMKNAQGVEQQARAAAELVRALEAAYGSAANMPPEFLAAYRAAAQVAAEAAKIAKATDDATAAAGRLTPAVMAAYSAYYKARVEASNMADETARAAAAMDALSEANRRGAENYGQVGARGDPRQFQPGGAKAQTPGVSPFQFTPAKAAGGGGGGGGGGGNPLADRLVALQESLMTESELTAQWYAESMATLDEALAAKMIKETEYMTAREALEKEHQDRLNGIRGAGAQTALGTVLQTGQDILNAMGQTNSKALKAAQAFGAGIALINAYTAASEALKDPTLPWWGRVAAAGKVLAAGIGFVNAIKGANSAAGAVGSSGAAGGAAASQGPGQTIAIRYDGPDFARQPIEAVVGQISDFIKRGGRIDGIQMA